MVDERKEILDLPTKESVATDDAFYFEIQEAVGGAGSSKKLSRAVLYAAIVAALPPMEHSSLTDLGADDHPQYHTDERGDLRYAPISIMGAADPFPQYQQADEVDTQIDAKVAALKQEADPFPIYETSVEAQAKVDAKMAEHLAASDPHSQYETSTEAQAKVDAKMAEHLAAPDPHPQYASNAELQQEVANAVGPIAQVKVQEYIASEGEAIIDASVQVHMAQVVSDAIAAHVAESDPHPQYLQANNLKNPITTLVPVAGVVTIDCAVGDYFYCELAEDISVEVVNPPAAGYAQTIYMQFKQDGTGGHTVSLPAEFKPNGGSDTEVAGTANSYTDLAATTMNSGARWAYSMQEQV